MAEQNPNPLPWHDSMSDGCSGVLDLGFTKACTAHDKKYHYGGPTPEEKLIADDQFYQDMCATPGFWGWAARRGIARERGIGVRNITYSYPPRHPSRVFAFHKIDAWNWEGPGMPEEEVT